MTEARIDELPCIFPASREFRPFRDGFARDCSLQRGVWCEPGFREPFAEMIAHDAISRPDQSERKAPLAPGAALIVIVLLSLGLWSAIWWVVSSLASAD